MRLNVALLAAIALALVAGASFRAMSAGPSDTQNTGTAMRARYVPLDEDRHYAAHGISLTVPPDSFIPRISLEEASVRAWEEEGIRSATEATATLGMFRNPYMGVEQERPMWIVTYHGVCLPVFGPPGGDKPDCAGDKWHVVIDATDGKFIEAYG